MGDHRLPIRRGHPAHREANVYDLQGDDATAKAVAAIYVWHCDRAGSYSMYDGDAVGDNHLRVECREADADGNLRFTPIFPSCYAGRWPHMHFEVYASLGETVYATESDEESVGNLARVSLDSDGIFSDGDSLQTAKVTGSVTGGCVNPERTRLTCRWSRCHERTPSLVEV